MISNNGYLLEICLALMITAVSGRYLLVRTTPKLQSQVEYLRALKVLKQGLKAQFWRPADLINRHVDIWLPEKSIGRLERILKKVKLHMEIITPKNDTRNDSNVDIIKNIIMKNIEQFDKRYNNLEEVVSELKRLTAGYRNLTKLKIIGLSYQKRNLYAIEIKKNRSSPKPLIMINSGIHGREWLAVGACMCLLRRILFNYQYDANLGLLLDNFDITFVSVLNPDGYIQSFTKDRYSRKSRSPIKGSHCIGIDINRNFRYRWGGGGSSADPCEETYSGPKPFSETESLSLARYLYSNRHKLKIFLDVHAFGQLWMSPWGFTKYPSHHAKTQNEVMKRIKRAISVTTGESYRIGSASKVLYETAGDSTDWVYGFLGVVHSYGAELRPSMIGGGSFAGFKHPSTEIGPSSDELLAGLMEIVKYVMEEPNVK